ncbi:LacI family DNA-binding transcriptional regulator [Sphingomonas sp. 2R-10]|uniref:LacI family DNA-binding transcriptional regulator n=1 Tax=Sphingomonas sp. 2R-10 TaxID=3045148 RepID=UPI000F77C8ED|nr:LacI family DNA-binding transcriptional regulator [Sphingomonas sp. 2R-10]MDJ0275730.1 LacI family DNA-binding transcriptional regulator [Sphingomonas sp. 2R-10]
MANATIRDVARAADVSVASVSRVLNRHENVRPALREKVQAAAASLGYVPHAGARSLSLARSNAIGVVLPELHGEFFSELLRGMDREASERGLQLLLSNMHADPARAVEALHTMRGRVDGLVVMAPHIDPDQLLGHLPVGVPAVMVNCAPHHQPRPELRIDNATGARMMVDHLVATGRRRIVHVAGPEGNVDAEERIAGYRAAMADARLDAMVERGTFLEDSGVAIAQRLIGRGVDVDAVFAANDMMAIGVLTALRRAGIAVPDRIAVAGFDDIPLARLISPALTTLRINIAQLGERAVARLIDQIDGADDHGIELRAPTLVVRDTTSPREDPENRGIRGNNA